MQYKTICQILEANKQWWYYDDEQTPDADGLQPDLDDEEPISDSEFVDSFRSTLLNNPNPFVRLKAKETNNDEISMFLNDLFALYEKIPDRNSMFEIADEANKYVNRLLDSPNNWRFILEYDIAQIDKEFKHIFSYSPYTPKQIKRFVNSMLFFLSGLQKNIEKYFGIEGINSLSLDTQAKIGWLAHVGVKCNYWEVYIEPLLSQAERVKDELKQTGINYLCIPIQNPDNPPLEKMHGKKPFMEFQNLIYVILEIPTPQVNKSVADGQQQCSTNENAAEGANEPVERKKKGRTVIAFKDLLREDADGKKYNAIETLMKGAKQPKEVALIMFVSEKMLQWLSNKPSSTTITNEFGDIRCGQSMYNRHYSDCASKSYKEKREEIKEKLLQLYKPLKSTTQ